MRTRYTKDKDGKLVRQADVYTKDEHKINLQDIDPDALFITRKLRAAGFEAYIVGGAVRDLLVGRKPKDFDVATDAHPRSIKKVLPFSRIIGKRFRLVHVYFPGDKIIELATFRSNTPGDSNVFGTMDEDVKRRDFTLNALFYDPKDECVIDHVGGFQDIKKRKLQNVIPLDIIFKEDPVRMLRAVKYATAGGFAIPWNISSRIKKEGRLMAQISPSRLTEEFFKILQSGISWPVFSQLQKYKILEYFCPKMSQGLKQGLLSSGGKSIKVSLESLDDEVKTSELSDRSVLVAFLILPLLVQFGWNKRATTENFEDIIAWLKEWFKPIIPSNKELDSALRDIYRGWAIRPPRKRPPRRRGHGAPMGEAHGEGEKIQTHHAPNSQTPGKPGSSNSRRRRRPRRPGENTPKL